MLPMPELSALEYQALLDDMRLGPYYAQPRAALLDFDHRQIMDLSDLVEEGQVDCKLEGAGKLRIVTRSATVTIADPRRGVPVTAGAATAGAAHFDKMVATGIRFRGPRLGRWVTIPTSCGPINGVSRRGEGRVEIVTQGKERLASGMVWDDRTTYRKGSLVVDAMADLLRRAGESATRINIPGLTTRLAADLAVAFDDTAWQHLRTLAGNLDRNHFYDARGTYRVRAWPSTPSLVFTDGDGGTLLGDPEYDYPAWSDYNDGAGIFNGVRVVGPKNGNHIPTYTAWLPDNHPMSPTQLKWGGKPYRRARVTQKSQVRTDAQARELAEQEVNTLSRELVTVQSEALPNWLLEPGDVYAAQTDAIGYVEQVATEFSLPLMPGAAMSIGVTANVSRPKVTVTKAPKPPKPRPGKGGRPGKNRNKNRPGKKG